MVVNAAVRTDMSGAEIFVENIYKGQKILLQYYYI